MRALRLPPLASLVLVAGLAACGELVPALDAGAADAAATDATDAAAIDAAAIDATTPPDLTGRFLLGVAFSGGSVALEWTISDWWRAADGSVRFVGTLQPLANPSLAPVGNRHAVPAAAATATGDVEFQVTSMVLPPDSTSAHIQLVYTASFHAVIVDADHACGTLPAGMITNPFQTSLVGLPWAAVRIPPGGPLPPLETQCP